MKLDEMKYRKRSTISVRTKNLSYHHKLLHQFNAISIFQHFLYRIHESFQLFRVPRFHT